MTVIMYIKREKNIFSHPAYLYIYIYKMSPQISQIVDIADSTTRLWVDIEQ